MTLGLLTLLVKAMKLNQKIIDRLVRAVFTELKAQNVITYKEKEEAVFKFAVDLIKGDLEREKVLDGEVNRMLDRLEQENPGEFQRFKMFPMLKRKMAKEKGIIL